MSLRQITGTEILGSEGNSLLKGFSSVGAREKEAPLKALPPRLRHLSKSAQLSLWRPSVTSSHAGKKGLEETASPDCKMLGASQIPEVDRLAPSLFFLPASLLYSFLQLFSLNCSRSQWIKYVIHLSSCHMQVKFTFNSPVCSVKQFHNDWPLNSIQFSHAELQITRTMNYCLCKPENLALC